VDEDREVAVLWWLCDATRRRCGQLAAHEVPRQAGHDGVPIVITTPTTTTAGIAGEEAGVFLFVQVHLTYCISSSSVFQQQVWARLLQTWLLASLQWQTCTFPLVSSIIGNHSHVSVNMPLLCRLGCIPMLVNELR
jgi:hypothetical protein